MASWNDFQTDTLSSMVAGVSMMTGGAGSEIHAYIARPDGEGPYPGVVLIHHVPGWDEFYREFARRFAEHGYIAIVPNLFEQYGHGTPSEVAARARADGYPADDAVVADAEASAAWLRAQPSHNGKVGVIGSCSGGRHSALIASRSNKFDAAVCLWGGGIVAPPEQLSEKQPVAPIDLAPQLSAPMLGLFGNDDRRPSPDDVNKYEEALKAAGKTPVFVRYDGAGHGFFYYQGTSYRPEAAMDGWEKVDAFFKEHLVPAM
ncbi:MAG: dienelactone hydrolase family protein [Chloroflexota bacterium]